MTNSTDQGSSLAPGSFYLMGVVMSTVLMIILLDCIRATIDHSRRMRDGQTKMLAALDMTVDEYEALIKKADRKAKRAEADRDSDAETEKTRRSTRKQGSQDSYASGYDDPIGRKSSSFSTKA